MVRTLQFPDSENGRTVYALLFQGLFVPARGDRAQRDQGAALLERLANLGIEQVLPGSRPGEPTQTVMSLQPGGGAAELKTEAEWERLKAAWNTLCTDYGVSVRGAHLVDVFLDDVAPVQG